MLVFPLACASVREEASVRAWRGGNTSHGFLFCIAFHGDVVGASAGTAVHMLLALVHHGQRCAPPSMDRSDVQEEAGAENPMQLGSR